MGSETLVSSNRGVAKATLPYRMKKKCEVFMLRVHFCQKFFVCHRCGKVVSLKVIYT